MAADPRLKRRRQVIIASVVTLFTVLMAASMVTLPAYNERARTEREIEIARQQANNPARVPESVQQALVDAVPTADQVQGRLGRITSAAEIVDGIEFRSARPLAPPRALSGTAGLSAQAWQVRVAGPLSAVAGLVGALRQSVQVDRATGVTQVRGSAPVRISRVRIEQSGGRALAVIDLDAYLRP